MAQAVRLHERITTRQTQGTTTMTTKLSLTAAELATAGFVANDDVIIIVWVMVAQSITENVDWQITYNGTSLHAGATARRYDCATAGDERSSTGLFRVDLGGTVTDIDIDLASEGTEDVYIEKAEIVIVRAEDLGVENTDWFWNESTTLVTHTATWSATDQASITFTPASVEDWVVLGCTETQVNHTQKNHEYRMNLDAGTILGSATISEEGEDTQEEKMWTMFDYLSSLAASEHTIDNEVQDDAGSPNHATTRSALLIFRTAIWADLYIHDAGSIAVTNDTDVQVATITDTLSGAQDVVMLGMGAMTEGEIFDYFMWIRDGGSTVIDPVADQSSGLMNGRTFDTTDVPLLSLLAFKNLSGTLDLDLFAHQNATGSENLDDTKFLVWGMELASAGPGGLPPRFNQQVYHQDDSFDNQEQVFA